MITTITDANPRTCAACRRPLITQEMFDKRGAEIEKETGSVATIGDVTANLPEVFPNHCDVRNPNGNGCRYWERRALIAERVIAAVEMLSDHIKRNSARYERLRILGAWMQGKDNNKLLTFQNLDDFVDADIKLMPSRGEAKGEPSKPFPIRDLVIAEPIVGSNGRWLVTLSCGHKVYTDQKRVAYRCVECPREELEIAEAQRVETRGMAPPAKCECGHLVGTHTYKSHASLAGCTECACNTFKERQP